MYRFLHLCLSVASARISRQEKQITRAKWWMWHSGIHWLRHLDSRHCISASCTANEIYIRTTSSGLGVHRCRMETKKKKKERKIRSPPLSCLLSSLPPFIIHTLLSYRREREKSFGIRLYSAHNMSLGKGGFRGMEVLPCTAHLIYLTEELKYWWVLIRIGWLMNGWREFVVQDFLK